MLRTAVRESKGARCTVFVIGQSYVRRDLHARYGGQTQGGVSTPASYPVILLFTGEQGQQYGYQDGWTDDDAFLFGGEGQSGDMTFTRGNRAILNHAEEGKDLHLFESTRKGMVRYVGQMVCTGYEERLSPDRAGLLRKVFVFELVPVSAFISQVHVDHSLEDDHWDQPLSVLRDRALSLTLNAHDSLARKQSVRYRSGAIRVYVLKRAAGICEGCGQMAPFADCQGMPYLEPHHIRRLTDGGPDHPHWVIALCPVCHRRAHFGEDSRDFNAMLARIVQDIEASLSA